MKKPPKIRSDFGHVVAGNLSCVREFEFTGDAWSAEWINFGAVPTFFFLAKTRLPRAIYDREAKAGRIDSIMSSFRFCEKPVELVTLRTIHRFNARVRNREFAHIQARAGGWDTNAAKAAPENLLVSEAEANAALCS